MQVGQCKELDGPVLVEPIEGGGQLGERGLVLARTLVNVPTEVVPVRVWYWLEHWLTYRLR